MNLEETKTTYLGLSLKAFLIIGGILSASGTTIYFAITKYNQISDLADNYQPYDDGAIKDEINRLKLELEGTKTSLNAVKDSMVLTSNQLVAVSEKASTAKGEAMEAKAIANGNARETQASLMGVREEVKATREGIEAKMKALQRATTNPLGN
jgi:hypothetical protein